MARVGDPPPAVPLADPHVRVAAVVTGFHRGVAEALLVGARERLAACGLPDGALDVHWVPGAFEAPLACRAVARSGRYAAILVLGAVVRGETPNFGFVCEAAVAGISRVALEDGIPVGHGLLTVDTLAQAEARAGGAVGNAGVDAADAVVAMINLIGACAPARGV